MNELNNHNHVNIPSLLVDDLLKEEWIRELAIIAKTTNTQARKIITKDTKGCIKKDISKYRKLYDTSPKKVNRKVFKNYETPPLDCIYDRNNNILTNPKDIANGIHIQQSISNRPTVPTCYFLPNHLHNCMCGINNIYGMT